MKHHPIAYAISGSGSQGSRQIWNRLERIRCQPGISRAENRRFGILVNSDDDLVVPIYAGPVLNGTADAAGQLQVRRDEFASLAYLPSLR